MPVASASVSSYVIGSSRSAAWASRVIFRFASIFSAIVDVTDLQLDRLITPVPEIARQQQSFKTGTSHANCAPNAASPVSFKSSLIVMRQSVYTRKGRHFKLTHDRVAVDH